MTLAPQAPTLTRPPLLPPQQLPAARRATFRRRWKPTGRSWRDSEYLPTCYRDSGRAAAGLGKNPGGGISVLIAPGCGRTGTSTVSRSSCGTSTPWSASGRNPLLLCWADSPAPTGHLPQRRQSRSTPVTLRIRLWMCSSACCAGRSGLLRSTAARRPLRRGHLRGVPAPGGRGPAAKDQQRNRRRSDQRSVQGRNGPHPNLRPRP